MMSKSTALITFMLEAPPDAFSVQLLGSWDNFHQPYDLSRDKRAGRTQWRGCHQFENITCDGDLSDSSLRRNGALMMGGTYWYYYRLNGDWDYHDPVQPSTTACPTLPGQTMNVLDIPVQVNEAGTSSSDDSLESLVFTLDPKDKYAPLGVRRAATTSAVQRQKHFDSESKCAVEPPVIPDFSYDNQESMTPVENVEPTRSPQHGLYSAIQRLRRTKSSGLGSQRGPSRLGSAWSRKLLSRAKSSRRAEPDLEVPEVPKITPELVQQMHDLALASNREVAGGKGATMEPAAQDPRSRSRSTTEELVSPTPVSKHTRLNSDAPSLLSSTDQNCVPSDSPVSSLVASPEPVNAFAGDSAICLQSMSDRAPSEEEKHCSTTTQPLDEADSQHKHVHNIPDMHVDQIESQYDIDNEPHAHQTDEAGPSSLSYTSSEYCSPGLVSNSASSRRISSIHLSQPETPVAADFDDNAIAWQRHSDQNLETYEVHGASEDFDFSMPPKQAPHEEGSAYHLGGFQGYSLPNHEQVSSVTIKKPPTRECLPPLPTHSSGHLVHAWNDGNSQGISGAAGMLDELGYLGTMIN